jgi:hypothetical protein
LFVPLLISSGGNSGSQASTLVIRAMALGEVTLADWLTARDNPYFARAWIFKRSSSRARDCAPGRRHHPEARSQQRSAGTSSC